MPISKEKKKAILGTLKTVAAAKSLAFVNFHGLTVANATELRRKLKASGVSYLVAKKSLAKKAFGEAGITGVIPELKGELGIAYLSAEASAEEDLSAAQDRTEKDGDDAAPAREVFAFQKKFENRISLLGGVFEGKFIGAEEIKALALIPSLQTLRAQFVNLINSPIQRFAVVLDAIAQVRAK
ncbi:MAG: 50S ribosomal protein L10 [Candidatus Taylorbacteria bacterium]|nr:50S ribosomal protein L10 [Candidatus Taylorbacteria bacterium]